MISFSSPVFSERAMPKLVGSKTCPPVGALVSARAVSSQVSVEVTWGQATSLNLDSGVLGATAGPGASRSLAAIITRLGV